MKETLNPSQQAAVSFDGKHVLIIAGPGTGKTHTLTSRVRRLLEQSPEDHHFLAITFTRKAAAEMATRIGRLRKKGADNLEVGTFHQFALRVLKDYPNETRRIAESRLTDSDEALEHIRELWPSLSSRQRKDRLAQISQWKSVDFEKPMPPEVAAFQEARYSRQLIDYDDLLLELYHLLKREPAILKAFHHRLRYIFVDEYQDVNPVQHRILKMLAGPLTRLTAIGDPNQAIYGFRGSDVHFFQSFDEDFPGARRFSLNDNYRSGQDILSASRQILTPARPEFDPELSAKMLDPGWLTVHTSPTDHAEAEYVVHQIEKLIGGTSLFSHDSGRVSEPSLHEYSFGDFVVLYRLKSQKHAIIKALERSGMPFHACGETSGEESVDEVCPHPSVEFETDAEHIQLMTMHASKGLEFPVVFITGCEETIIPLDRPGICGDPDEERRLLYVAMTRAGHRLYLLHARKRFLYGERVANPPSRFLSDIRDELKKVEEIRNKRRVRKASDEEQLSLF